MPCRPERQADILRRLEAIAPRRPYFRLSVHADDARPISARRPVVRSCELEAASPYISGHALEAARHFRQKVLRRRKEAYELATLMPIDAIYDKSADEGCRHSLMQYGRACALITSRYTSSQSAHGAYRARASAMPFILFSRHHITRRKRLRAGHAR